LRSAIQYADGAGVQAFLTASTAGTAGAGTFQLTYTNGGGTGPKTTPSSPALPTNTATSPLLDSILGVGSGKYGPFSPLSAATRMPLDPEHHSRLGGVTTGVYNLVLCKPLITLPLTTLGVAAEREFVSQLPDLPRVYDGACLQWLTYAQAAIPNDSALRAPRFRMVVNADRRV